MDSEKEQRADKALAFAKHAAELIEAFRRPLDPKSSEDLLADIESCVQAMAEVLESGCGLYEYRRVGGLGYCGRKERGGCAAVDTRDDGSVYCMDSRGCLPIKTDWKTYE